MKKLTLILFAIFALLPWQKLAAQTSLDSIGHRFTHLKLEARVDFDVQHDFAVTNDLNSFDTTNYGFNGKYFNLILGGEFGKGFSYFFRQRIIANSGTFKLFDNTDYLYLQYQINDRWTVRVGKEALANGGFEYDAAPIDVYFYTNYWGNIYCFQLAGTVTYTDKSGRNNLTLQVSNSPYVYYSGDGNEWRQGLLGYSLMWSGKFNHFHALYSVNMFERQRGKFVNHITLGNKLTFGRWSWYVDYQNRASSFRHFFDDFFVVSRMDVAIKDVNLFVKAGYEQNLSDVPYILPIRDPLMDAGQRALFYGLGVEYHPRGSEAVRLHAVLYRSRNFPTCDAVEAGSSLNAQVGLTWNVDFLRYFKNRLNSIK